MCTLGAVAFLAGSSCAARPVSRSGVAAEPPVRAEQAKTLKFRVWRCMDEKGVGGEVFRMLVPADWKAEGAVTWKLDVPMAPAYVAFRAWNPTGAEAIEGFPNQPFFWTDNGGLLQMFPPGSKYFGCEVRKPTSIEDALQRIVAARFRKDVSDLHVVSRAPMPEIVKALGLDGRSPGGGLSLSASAGKVRTEYAIGGKGYTEDLIGVRESLKIPVRGTMASFTNENWTLSYLVGMRAARGELDGASKLFVTMASSIRLNKEWFNRYVQVVEMLIQGQMQRIRMAGEFSRILAQTSAEISAERMDLYERRQRAYERVSDTFSDYMRDIDRYTDPNGDTVLLPSGYKNAWVNGLGEYVVADREDYNPNVGSNQNWQPLSRR